MEVDGVDLWVDATNRVHMSIAPPSKTSPKWRPQPSGNATTDQTNRVVFDNFQQLATSLNSSTSGLAADLSALTKKVNGIKLSVSTTTLRYKDWNGNNASQLVVTGVKLEGL